MDFPGGPQVGIGLLLSANGWRNSPVAQFANQVTTTERGYSGMSGKSWSQGNGGDIMALLYLPCKLINLIRLDVVGDQFFEVLFAAPTAKGGPF